MQNLLPFYNSRRKFHVQKEISQIHGVLPHYQIYPNEYEESFSGNFDIDISLNLPKVFGNTNRDLEQKTKKDWKWFCTLSVTTKKKKKCFCKFTRRAKISGNAFVKFQKQQKTSGVGSENLQEQQKQIYSSLEKMRDT